MTAFCYINICICIFLLNIYSLSIFNVDKFFCWCSIIGWRGKIYYDVGWVRESEKSSLIVFVSVVFVTWELWFDEWNSFHGNPNDNVWLSHSQIIFFFSVRVNFFRGWFYLFSLNFFNWRTLDDEWHRMGLLIKSWFNS